MSLCNNPNRTAVTGQTTGSKSFSEEECVIDKLLAEIRTGTSLRETRTERVRSQPLNGQPRNGSAAPDTIN